MLELTGEFEVFKEGKWSKENSDDVYKYAKQNVGIPIIIHDMAFVVASDNIGVGISLENIMRGIRDKKLIPEGGIIILPVDYYYQDYIDILADTPSIMMKIKDGT